MVRRGDKCVTTHLIGYRLPAGEARVGIIVTVKTGNAVVRNTVRRRIRSIARKLIDAGRLDGDVVFRLRGEGMVPSFSELESELGQCAAQWES